MPNSRRLYERGKTLPIALTGLFAALCFLTCVLRPVQAQEKKQASVAPSLFLGKAFAQCEKILGNPALVENPKGKKRSYARYYISGIRPDPNRS